MSAVVAIPELMQSAAEDLAGIRSMLGEVDATAAAPTTGLLAAAEDEVSTAIASVFKTFGQQYQQISSQAAAFHDEFVRVLNGGANAYADAEAVNAQTALSPLASNAGIAGPYQTLFTNTTANLRLLGDVLTGNPAPFLRQLLVNQLGYGQTIVADLRAFVQNFPVSLQTGVQQLVHAAQNFDLQAFLRTVVNNQIGYYNTISAALGNAAQDFTTGLQALPAAFQTAFQDLVAGNFSGAASAIGGGFVDLFVTGVDFKLTGLNTFTITPTGTIGDLLPLLTVPGAMGQNVANLLPPGSIPQQIALNYTHAVNTALDTSIAATLTTKLFPLPPTATLTAFYGMPVALLVDALGAPLATLDALNTSVTAFTTAAQSGNWLGAAGALVDAPAVAANGFLNGHTTMPVSFPLGSATATINFPFDGILVPADPYSAVVTVGGFNIPVTVAGTPLGGFLPALLTWAPEQLAEAIGKT